MLPHARHTGDEVPGTTFDLMPTCPPARRQQPLSLALCHQEMGKITQMSICRFKIAIFRQLCTVGLLSVKLKLTLNLKGSLTHCLP